MKTISVLIPCYNEEENVRPICEAVRNILRQELSEYDYEIIFIDNKSRDHTRRELLSLCEEDKKVKAIFNINNFGQFNSPYYGLCQTSGDCAIMMSADFQDPVSLIPLMVHEWEKGHKVVASVKTRDKESRIVYMLRTLYYKMLKAASNIDQIEHFTGFGLYDRSFLEILKQLDDPTPFLRSIVAEYAPDCCRIEYEHQKRRAGKSSNNFFTLFDAALLSFTSYTKGGLRLATFGGFFITGISFLIAGIYFILKLLHWNDFNAGNAPILLGVFFLGGLQFFFIGLLGEYIMSMNTRIIHRPLVIEECRINFDPLAVNEET